MIMILMTLDHLEVSESVRSGGDDDVRARSQATAQQGLDQLQRTQTLLGGELGREAGQGRHPGDLVQPVYQEQQPALAGSGLYVGDHVRVRGNLGQDILYMFLQKLLAAHWSQVVESSALDEDENIKVVSPEESLAPLETHVLQHGALPYPSRGLDRDHGGKSRPHHRDLPGVLEQVVDGDVLGVVIGFREILQHLGPVVHVQLGGLLPIVGGDHQLLVQTPGAALPSAVAFLGVVIGVVPLGELGCELFPYCLRQSEGGRRWSGLRWRRSRRGRRRTGSLSPSSSSPSLSPPAQLGVEVAEVDADPGVGLGLEWEHFVRKRKLGST